MTSVRSGDIFVSFFAVDLCMIRHEFTKLLDFVVLKDIMTADNDRVLVIDVE
jgi:hypothetical protein